MRKLTLILSDLYLPEEAIRDAVLPQTLSLPHLEWLLRFAHADRIADWRRWLALDLGRADLAAAPAATLAARAAPSIVSGSFIWLATPVRLEARLDHVRMLDRGLPRLAATERDDWRMEFARTFPPCALHDCGSRGFLLTGLAPAKVATVDPARLLDSDIARALPSGDQSRGLRQLAAEIEMWMHSSPLNLVRERDNLPRLSSLWLWGGGSHEASPALVSPLPAARPTLRFYGGDPALAGLARATTGESPADMPAGFESVRDAPDRIIVELTPMNGTAAEALPMLDANWFAPARAALCNGTLAALDIVANDRWFRLAANPSWRLWRPRRPWLTQLDRVGRQTKA